MGCSVRPKPNENNIIIGIQESLERVKIITEVVRQYPNIFEHRFTNLKMNLVHYIIHIGNNDLLRSWLVEFKDKTLNMADDNGNMPIHTAIIWRNMKAVKILVDFSDVNLLNK